VTRFSDTLMEHFQSPHHRGKLDRADAVGTAGIPGQGRYLTLYLQVADDCVSKVGYECHGCGVTIACGSALAELVLGQSLAVCARLTTVDIIDALDGIPAHKQDCAGFAIQALQVALWKYFQPQA
jgi:nitrogen fixation protein NifU and related proteins